ncbi:hypothetical protein CLG96_17490 [Sphingomonas oleivorans]|uniref:Circumsporozoite protein n=1 Tax=Sphingomonas oleivorans TaxID=1735121 RepID=A0A2T5FTF3_9SPHN|nr:hypothetical protein [Sphingomonas oleivorans]PTQ07347.1 hypothetical protein CLG96_17490 [Sphingomonas oleivorans]
MRDLFKKLTAVSLVAGAALMVSACGGTPETANTTDNTAMTDMNAMAPMEGSMNDMTAVDMGNDMDEMDNASNAM